MIHRPSSLGGFEFVVLATQRAAQLMRGCRPRLDGTHKATIMALFEVSEGKVARMVLPPADAPAVVATSLEPLAAVAEN